MRDTLAWSSANKKVILGEIPAAVNVPKELCAATTSNPRLALTWLRNPGTIVKELLKDLGPLEILRAISIKSDMGLTPLHWAVINGNPGSAREMLDNLDPIEREKLMMDLQALKQIYPDRLVELALQDTLEFLKYPFNASSESNQTHGHPTGMYGNNTTEKEKEEMEEFKNTIGDEGLVKVFTTGPKNSN